MNGEREARLEALVAVLVEALENVVESHCPNERLFCGSCTPARRVVVEARAELANGRAER